MDSIGTASRTHSAQVISLPDYIEEIAGRGRRAHVRRFPVARAARYYVRIDGKRYAGFDDYAAASQALTAWRKSWSAVADKELSLEVAS